jgi:hypothetical protein
MPKSVNIDLQTSRENVIREYMEKAPGSVLASELAELKDSSGKSIPTSAVRASLRRLIDEGKAFTAGHRRSARYGSTQQKADLSPFGVDQSAAA